MIVTCPSCSARFWVQRSSFGTGQRKGTCTKCQTELAIGPLPPPIASTVAKKLESGGGGQPVRKDKKNLIAPCFYYIKRYQRAWGVGGSLFLLAFLVILYITTSPIILGRYDHQRHTERAWTSKPSTLKIQNLKLSWAMKDRTVELSIRGELLNFSDKASKSQDLTIILLDNRDSQLHSWDHKIPPQLIPPKQHVDFYASAIAPPEEAVAAVVRINPSPTQ
jgi:predicted Zn finger-like uncharacterized protein